VRQVFESGCQKKVENIWEEKRGGKIPRDEKKGKAEGWSGGGITKRFQFTYFRGGGDGGAGVGENLGRLRCGGLGEKRKNKRARRTKNHSGWKRLGGGDSAGRKPKKGVDLGWEKKSRGRAGLVGGDPETRSHDLRRIPVTGGGGQNS